MPGLASFNENKQAAQRGGKVAGNARKETEKELGRSIVSEQNYLMDQPGIEQGNSLKEGEE